MTFSVAYSIINCTEGCLGIFITLFNHSMRENSKVKYNRDVDIESSTARTLKDKTTIKDIGVCYVQGRNINRQ